MLLMSPAHVSDGPGYLRVHDSLGGLIAFLHGEQFPGHEVLKIIQFLHADQIAVCRLIPALGLLNVFRLCLIR